MFDGRLLTRYEIVEPGVPYTAPALWLFAPGWAVARSRSMHISLFHWLVYPPLAGLRLPLALSVSLAAGVAYLALCNLVAGTAHRLLARK